MSENNSATNRVNTSVFGKNSKTNSKVVTLDTHKPYQNNRGKSVNDCMFNWQKSNGIKEDRLFSNLDRTNDKKDVTMLSDINTRRDSPTRIDGRIHIKLLTTMVDMVSSGEMPENTDIPCFWCRHSFTTPPIGLPIRWVNSKSDGVEKKCTTPSHNVGVDGNTITVVPEESTRKSINTKGYFQVDGIYCSFNCVLADLQSSQYNCMLKDSYTLLHKMFRLSMDRYPSKGEIKPMPSWRLTKKYGGPMSIEELRDTVQLYNYTMSYNIVKPVGRIFEKMVI